MAEDALRPYVGVGTVVKAFAGPCKVLEVRQSPKVFICEPVEWKLADYSSTQVKLFLNEDSVGSLESAASIAMCC